MLQPRIGNLLEYVMNERIKQLAKQASNEVAGAGFTMAKYEEKFAELIIRKCAFIVGDAVDHREPASTYVDKIKQHFGIE